VIDVARRTTLVLGLVIILIGLLLLLRALGIISVSVGGLVGAFVLIGIGAAMLWYFIARPEAAPLDVEETAIPLEGAAEASIRVSHGAGRVSVDASAGPDDLVGGTFGGGLDSRVTREGDRLDVQMRTPAGLLPAVTLPWRWGRGRGLEWTFGLNPSVPISLRVDSGASDMRLDLSELHVTRLRVSTGASSTVMTLPAAAGHTQVDVESGAASVRIRVPEGVGARIRVGGGLSSVSVDSRRFPRSGGVYQSPDYDSAANKADIRVETGVGSISVR
jgi:hypothetical protein